MGLHLTQAVYSSANCFIFTFRVLQTVSSKTDVRLPSNKGVGCLDPESRCPHSLEGQPAGYYRRLHQGVQFSGSRIPRESSIYLLNTRIVSSRTWPFHSLPRLLEYLSCPLHKHEYKIHILSEKREKHLKAYHIYCLPCYTIRRNVKC